MITTHVLDTALGRPAAGLVVRLERVGESGAMELGRASTDLDGRVTDLGPAVAEPGTYRLIFETAGYWCAPLGHEPAEPAEPAFFPEVAVTFTVHGQARHCHVPLLLSPYGYATYRGT